MEGQQIRDQVKELTARKVVSKSQDYKNDACEDSTAFEKALSTFTGALESAQTANDNNIAWRTLLSLVVNYPQSLKRVLEALTAETKLEIAASFPTSTIATTSAFLPVAYNDVTFNFWFYTALSPLKNMDDDQTEYAMLLMCAAVHVLLLKLEEMAQERIDILAGVAEAIEDRKYGIKGHEMYAIG